MARRCLLLLAAILLVSNSALADDLLKVNVSSSRDVDLLRDVGSDPVVRLADGYLVLAGDDARERLDRSGLTATLIETGVTRAELALDNRVDSLNLRRFRTLFEQDGVRVLRVEPTELVAVPVTERPYTLVPAHPPLVFEPPVRTMVQPDADMVSLDSLISLVSEDSLQSYVEQLQSFAPRVPGLTGNTVARDYLIGQLESFGYDSIRIDTFFESIQGHQEACENILAYKSGTRYPGHQVIVGAHRDAVPVSPGADDNGSGSAGVLEIARILANVETDMTIIFALFDAEEWGLYGSWHYVDGAYARGDSIVYMLNMDMIGYYDNQFSALLYRGEQPGHAVTWQYLADSLLGVTAFVGGQSSGSDHYPFTQYGYDATFVFEYNFSTVYHSPHDSTSYMSFPYMARMVKPSLATVYFVSQTVQPTPWLSFDLPTGYTELISPGTAQAFQMDVNGAWEGVAVPSSCTMHYSIDGGPYGEQSLTEGAPGQYAVVLPELGCNQQVDFYFSADEQTSGAVLFGDSLDPFEVFTATDSTVVFADDFESDAGWAVSGNSTSGTWERGVPAGGAAMSAPPSDFDGSGQCYLTGNAAGPSDVDEGSTVLISPSIDLSAGDARIRYARWFSNITGDDPASDLLKIYLSKNGGLSWIPVDQAGPLEDARGGWQYVSFWASDFATPGADMKLRIEASDLITDSEVEAAFDAVSITQYVCEPEPSCCVGRRGNVDMVGAFPTEVDSGDLGLLVMFLFGEPGAVVLPCEGEADLDSGGIPDMVDSTDLGLLVQFLFAMPGSVSLADCDAVF